MDRSDRSGGIRSGRTRPLYIARFFLVVSFSRGLEGLDPQSEFLYPTAFIHTRRRVGVWATEQRVSSSERDSSGVWTCRIHVESFENPSKSNSPNFRTTPHDTLPRFTSTTTTMTYTRAAHTTHTSGVHATPLSSALRFPPSSRRPRRQPGHVYLAAPPHQASPVPSPEEDKEVMHESFMHAYENSLSSLCRIEGMQTFAGGMLARAQIPSQQYYDPLAHIFDEFDTDGSKTLSAGEVGKALRSRDVEITDAQVRMFVRAVFGEGVTEVTEEGIGAPR